jgi:Meiotically up-regulated gene 113
MKGYIYLIHAKGTNLYKIGLTTRSVEARLKELNGKQSPHELLLRHSIMVDADDVYRLEALLHRRFKKYNYRNEWFKFSKFKVGSVVRSMNAHEGRDRNLPFYRVVSLAISITLIMSFMAYNRSVQINCRSITGSGLCPTK